MSLIEDIKAGKLDEADLLEHVTDNDILISIAVAESKFSTAPILDIAAHDKDRRVRIAALNNPNIGQTTLKTLCNDNDIEIAIIAKEVLERK